MTDHAIQWDELVPLEKPFKGEENCFARTDTGGKYIYARHADGTWYAWNPSNNSWQAVFDFYCDILNDYVRRYYARRENV